MNLEFKHLLPQNFSSQSRVWIYQSSKTFAISEALEIKILWMEFGANGNWMGAEVKVLGNFFSVQFLWWSPMKKEWVEGVGGPTG